MTRIRIKDVAAAAGVSIQTVSRVLNGERYVTEDKRLRVQEAVTRLDYRRSDAARILRTRQSFQIGLIHDNPSPYYVTSMQAGVRVRCEAGGYRMIVQPCDAASPTLVGDILGLIDRAQLDGIILTPPICDSRPVLDMLRQRGAAFVRVQPGHCAAASASTCIDNIQAADDMTAYLAGLGHRRIALVLGHPDYGVTGQRLAGYRRALTRAGLAFDPGLVCGGQFDFQSGAKAAAALLDLPVPPTAIFACSDEMAAGVLAAAHGRGIAVPAMLSVAGFDDIDLAGFVWPALTTIRQPTWALGHAAADLLLSPGEAGEERQQPHELIVRASVGPPAA